MKKYTLFILMSLTAFCAFGLTQEEKDKIYEAIIAEAKGPRELYSVSGIAPDRLFETNQRSPEEDCDEKSDPFWEAWNNNKEAARKAAEYLRSLPPSKIIPAYYELKLEGKLRAKVDRYAEIRLSETNKYDKASLLYVSNEKAIVPEKGELGLDFYCDRCRPNSSLLVTRVANASYVGDLKAYWWLEGRRFMPEIWNDWYPCWKNEMARKKPREYVVDNLIRDIAPLGTFLLPYLNEAIKAGDDSLASILKAVRSFPELNLPSVNEFCEWYSTNHFKYDYPPCEGIRKTIERVTDPYILSELKGEDTYDDKEKYGDKWAFDELDRQMFKQVLWQTEDYYKNRKYPPGYWYYRISDDAAVENFSDYCKEMHKGKINERFLKKIEKSRNE